ncbi:MAG: beta-phosphoglucomutase family hydrolase [Planctomycetaceae bacterium]|nr:beta-phosphoglucomutase family hydrolase [Planctomycetaceae bacterium]
MDDQPTTFSAIIFDCDGTLVDSMPSHYIAWVQTVADYGLTFDEDRFYALGGWPTIKVAQLVIEENDLDVSAQKLTDIKEARFEENLDKIKIIQPVVDVVEEYYGKLPLAVGTGAIDRICREMLTHVGLLDRFEAIVAADHVQHHKPAPDTYLEAARQLSIPAAECLVYEDTQPGIEAALAAGMQVVDVRDFYTPERITA